MEVLYSKEETKKLMMASAEVAVERAEMVMSVALFLRWIADESFLVQMVAKGIAHGYRQGMNETLFKGWTNDGA